MTPLQESKSRPRGFLNLYLTRELSQDLLNGHAAGVRVSVGAVGGDEVIGGVDGGLYACCTRFLQEKTSVKTRRQEIKLKSK